MTPEQTQELLRLVTALWPRCHLSEDTIDAWAVALTPIDVETGKRAVIEHSRGPDGRWPPAIADITATMRTQQRNIRPASQVINVIRADAAAAARDAATHTQRVTAVSTRIGTTAWVELLDQARGELIFEYGHSVIPTRLIAARAIQLAEEDTP